MKRRALAMARQHWATTIRSRIARRLTTTVLVIGLIGTFAATALQAIREYDERLAKLSRHLESIGDNSAPALEQSIWTLDLDQARLLVEGLSRFSDLTAARLQLDDGTEISFGSLRKDANILVRTRELKFQDGDKINRLGSLTLSRDLEADMDTLIRNTVINTAEHFSIIFAACISLILLYNHFITNRVLTFNNHIRELTNSNWRRLDDTEAMSPPAVINDELDSLVASVLRLHQTARAAVQTADENERRFRDFAEAAGDVFWETDAEHRYRWVSERISEIQGKPREWYYGKSRLEFIRLAEAEQDAEQQIEAMLAHHRFRDLEHHRLTPNAERWYRSSGLPKFDEAGRFTGFHGTTTDITAWKQAQKSLDDERDRLDRAIGTIPEGFALFDRDGQLILSNARYEELAAGLPGDLLPGDFQQGQSEEQDSGTATIVEPQEIQMPGNEWVRLARYPMSDGGIAAILTDITPLKLRQTELEEERNRVLERDEELQAYRDKLEDMIAFRTRELEQATRELRSEQKNLADLLTTTAEGFWFIDPNGMTIDVNPAMCGILAQERDEIMGRTIYDFVDDENLSIFKRELANRGTARNATYEIALQRPDGQNISCINNAAAIFDEDGKRVGSIGLWTDITERKVAERALTEAKEKAQAADLAKSEFLASVSHELRTPMNGILGMVNLLNKTGLNDRQSRYADRIKQSGSALLGLLNDILDLSKIEAGKIELDKNRFAIRHLLDEVDGLMRNHAKEKGLRYEVRVADDVPSSVVADQIRIRQVLLNFVSNAIKFTETGRIAISVSRIADSNAGLVLRFEVSDTGIGIEASNLDRIFEKFTQADTSTTRLYGGTGLGLAISSKLATLMGGEIGVDSIPGEGASFWFTVPCNAAVEEDPIQARNRLPCRPEAQAQDLRSLRVLLAEDNEVNQEVAIDYLNEVVHQVDVVDNGADAVCAATDRDYDIILMDVHMPGMDGLTAATRIRELKTPAAQVPIVALTALAMTGDRERCLAAGMNDFVSKPFEPEDLIAAMRRCLGAKQPPRPADPPAQSASVQSLPTAVIDRAIADRMRNDKPYLWQRLVDAYLRTAPETYAQLSEAVTRENMAGATAAAHKLKSSSANVGAVRLADLCKSIERDARTCEFRTLLTTFHELSREFDDVIEALRSEAKTKELMS